MWSLFKRAAAIVTLVFVPAAVGAQQRDAILDHIDAAEDVVESLLEWRHVVKAVESSQADRQLVGPSTTLISIEREQVAKLTGALDAIASMLPAPSREAAQPRGDLRAHVDKAREIAQELMPKTAPAPVGTSGSPDRSTANDAIVVVDRTALERLEVEIDAMERVAPRALRDK
jgi:hypothetical protein